MKILLISGSSGVGKTRIGLELAKDSKFNFIQSFTDRPHRPGEHKGDHQFVSKDFMKFILTYDIAAYTCIDNYHYCVTFSQFVDDKINVYIVDKNGADNIKQNFKDAQICSVLVIRDDINIDQIRKDRNIVIPKSDEVDIVLENNTKIIEVVENLKQEIMSYF